MVTAVRFPALSSDEGSEMEALLKSAFPGKPLTVSLDRLITSVQASQEKAKPVPLKTDPPSIMVSIEPAVLLTVQGDPVLGPIKGINLKFVLNANWDLFFDSDASKYYLLLDKLWLSANSLEGPWSGVSKLPADFSNFPDTEGWDHVRKAIPTGKEASAKVPKVFFTKEPAELIVFAGQPVYEKIKGTQLSYATNTDDWVFTDSADGQIYYLVTGRWFRAPKLEGPWTYAGDDLPTDASAPTGPWKICTDVPKIIYTIPPSSPVYHVTYVTVDSSTEDDVTCSYTAGYYGAYVASSDVLVWGTGYYYPPYIYTGAVPVYRPYYATYGVAAGYYPNAGVYAIGGYAYGPYASAGRAAWYNPATGGYGRVYTQQPPYGGRTSAWGYNPRTDTAWTTQQGHNSYAQWGKSTVTRGGETYQAGHVVTQHGSTAVAKGPDNLYAAHDGNVYKRDDNGNWSKWDDGGWQPVNPPTTNRSNQNLNAQNQERNQRIRDKTNRIGSKTSKIDRKTSKTQITLLAPIHRHGKEISKRKGIVLRVVGQKKGPTS